MLAEQLQLLVGCPQLRLCLLLPLRGSAGSCCSVSRARLHHSHLLGQRRRLQGGSLQLRGSLLQLLLRLCHPTASCGVGCCQLCLQRRDVLHALPRLQRQRRSMRLARVERSAH